VTPKFVAPADPAARWTAAQRRGPAFFAYSANCLIDVDNAIIVDVEATTAIRQAEVLAAKRMVDRSMECFALYPARLIGDTAYGSAEMLDWLVDDRGIEPHITTPTTPTAARVERSSNTTGGGSPRRGPACRRTTCSATGRASMTATPAQ
jgi:hypothetical protein